MQLQLFTSSGQQQIRSRHQKNLDLEWKPRNNNSTPHPHHWNEAIAGLRGICTPSRA